MDLFSFISMLVFLASGVFSTIGNQILVYHGSGGQTMLTTVPIYIGMLSVAFIPGLNIPAKSSPQAEQTLPRHSRREIRRKTQWEVFMIATVDVFGSWASAIGLYYAGSGLYQVIYSSVVIFTALFSFLFLGKFLSFMQWTSIFIVSSGLALSAFSSSSVIFSDAEHLLAGIVVTFISTLLYSLTYVLDERILVSDRVDSTNLCSLTGLYGIGWTVLYMVVYVLPNWTSLVTEEVIRNNGSWTTIWIILILLCISDMLHSVSYFVMVMNVGGVSTGLLQSLRAILVYICSQLLFCGPMHQSQCFNAWKGISSLVVILGVTLFTLVPGTPRVKETSVIEG